MEGLTVKAFEANQLNFDGLLFLAVLGYVDAGFVKRSVGNAQLLGMVEGLENLVGNLCNYVFGYVLLLTANERNELGRIHVLLDEGYYVAVDQNMFKGCNRWVLKLGQIHQSCDVVLLCSEHRVQVSDVLGVVLKERQQVQLRFLFRGSGLLESRNFLANCVIFHETLNGLVVKENVDLGRLFPELRGWEVCHVLANS